MKIPSKFYRNQNLRSTSPNMPLSLVYYIHTYILSSFGIFLHVHRLFLLTPGRGKKRILHYTLTLPASMNILHTTDLTSLDPPQVHSNSFTTPSTTSAPWRTHRTRPPCADPSCRGSLLSRVPRSRKEKAASGTGRTCTERSGSGKAWSCWEAVPGSDRTLGSDHAFGMPRRRVGLRASAGAGLRGSRSLGGWTSGLLGPRWSGRPSSLPPTLPRVRQRGRGECGHIELVDVVFHASTATHLHQSWLLARRVELPVVRSQESDYRLVLMESNQTSTRCKILTAP